MDWPHDPDAPEASDDRRKYGMAIIAKKVDENEDFPLDADEFLTEHGEDPIRINHDTVVSLATIFDHVEVQRFRTIVDLHRAVGDALREGDFLTYHPDGAEV